MELLKKLTPSSVKILNSLHLDDILLINHLNFGDITTIRDLGEEGILRLKNYEAMISYEAILIMLCFLLVMTLVSSGMYIHEHSKKLNHIRLLEETLVIHEYDICNYTVIVF